MTTTTTETTTTTTSSTTDPTATTSTTTDPTDTDSTGSDTDSTATGTDASTGSTTGTPAVCGDGVMGDGEACDDGNIYDDDGCSSDCQTATCLVPVTHADVQAGVDDDACSTVWVMPGTYTENVAIDRDVIVEGVPLDPVTIDGNAAGSTITTDNDTVILRNLTVTGGMAQTGAGIVAAQSSVTLERCAVTGNTATGATATGGGIAVTQSDLTLIESSVDNNNLTGASAIYRGGGISAEASVVLITSGSAVMDNTISASSNVDTLAEGGGIAARDSSILINGGSTVSGNSITATASGSIYTLFGGGVSSNGAVAQVIVGDASIVNNELSTNSTTGASIVEGGGIYARDGAVDLAAGAVVDDNTMTLVDDIVGARGGGISLADVLFDAAGASVSGNSITITASDGGGRGGGFCTLMDGDILAFTESQVIGNTVTVNATTSGIATGAGVFAEATGLGAVEFYRSTLSGNHATGDQDSDGGGLTLSPRGDGGILAGFFRNSTVSGNTSDASGTARGGAVFSESTATQDNDLVFVNSTVANNTATDEGGGLMLIDGGGGGTTHVVRHTIVYGNTAAAGPACSGTLVVTDVNVLGPMLDGCTIADTTNQIIMDPSLGALGDNGGSTPTHDIDDLSVAHDAGAATCQDDAFTITVDQRGLPRTGNCTIGSYEPQ